MRISIRHTVTLFIISLGLIPYSTLFAQKKAPIHLSQSVKHAFSDPDKKDSFNITLVGNNYLYAHVTFQIFDYNGKRIYLDSFPSKYLLGFSEEPNDPVEKLSSVIRKRIKDFFEEENFFSPAIGKTEIYEKDYTELPLTVWKEVRSNKQLGFYFLVGEENGRRIVYIPRLHKVVVYFSCC